MRALLQLSIVIFGLVCAHRDARAQEQNNLTFGHGIICDTSQQIQRYLTLYKNDTSPAMAADTVNTETKSPHGCGMAQVAFIPGDELGSVSVSGGMMRMLRITVYAMRSDSGWVRVSPTPQYTAIFIKMDEA